MKDQMNFSDIEYSSRRRKTKRDEFLEIMNAMIPWDAWVKIVGSHSESKHRGRHRQDIERMLRMTLLQNWFSLSDEGIEDAIYDSYAMKKFMGIHFDIEQVPDATTLCRFRKLLNEHGLQEQFLKDTQRILEEHGKKVCGGTIVDATIIDAPSSTKNQDKQRDPEMHSVRKGNQWHFGARCHIGVDPVHGFVHTVVTTAANAAECKVAPQLLRPDDTVVYGDAGYLQMGDYVTDSVAREYRINIQRGTYKRHHGDSLAWQIEKQIENRKSSMRCKVEYAFHIVKNIFKWRKLRYKGIHKNNCHANLLFACANLYMLAGSKTRNFA